MSRVTLVEGHTCLGSHLLKVYRISFRELLWDYKNNAVYPEGTMVKNPKYAESLRQIAKNYDDLNTGNLSKILLEDVNNNGGNMTADDLKNYVVLEKDPIQVPLSENLTLHTSPLPGGGSVLVHILNMVKGMYVFNHTLS